MTREARLTGICHNILNNFRQFLQFPFIHQSIHLIYSPLNTYSVLYTVVHGMYRPPIAKGEKHNRLITIECDMCNETVLLSFYVIAIP